MTVPTGCIGATCRAEKVSEPPGQGNFHMPGLVEHRLAELGIVLPRPPRAIGNFAYGIEHAGILYLSGTYGTAVGDDGEDFLPDKGKVGGELSIEDGYRSARF